MTATFHRHPGVTEKLPRFVPDACQHFTLQRVDVAQAHTVQFVTGRCQLGAAEGNDLRVDDATVSRFHCEVGVERGIASVKDLGSSNGTFVDGLQIKEAYLREGSRLRLGPKVTLEFRLLETRAPLRLSERTAFGEL